VSAIISSSRRKRRHYPRDPGRRASRSPSGCSPRFTGSCLGTPKAFIAVLGAGDAARAPDFVHGELQGPFALGALVAFLMTVADIRFQHRRAVLGLVFAAPLRAARARDFAIRA